MKKRLKGYAAVFNSPSEEMPGGFKEQIQEGTFSETIKKDDVRLLFNHDASLVLARNKAKTLKLSEDKKGLYFEASLPDTQLGRDLATSVERGDITSNSFGFFILSERWERRGGENIRVLEKVRLVDISAVTFPAYPATELHVENEY